MVPLITDLLKASKNIGLIHIRLLRGDKAGIVPIVIISMKLRWNPNMTGSKITNALNSGIYMIKK